MFPTFKFHSFVFGWYSIILTFTLVTCTIFFLIRFKRKAKQLEISKIKIFLFPFLIIIIGLIGIRLLNVVEHIIVTKEQHTLNQIKVMILYNGGTQFYGAPILILVLMPLLLRIYPLKEWLFFWDIVAPVWCLGYAMGRIGCFLSGDGCYGTWTNLPWGVCFPYGHPPNLIPVHPTPIYESLLHLILLIFVLKIDRMKLFLGQTFFFFLFFSSLSRFMIEFIRINPKMLGSLSLAQFISIFLMLSSSILFYKLRLIHKK